VAKMQYNFIRQHNNIKNNVRLSTKRRKFEEIKMENTYYTSEGIAKLSLKERIA
jgi:hypothetical protein